MKKFLKSFLVIMVAVCVALPLVACKKKASETTTDQSKVKTVSGVNTNGGMTVIYGDYLYFINGTKDNDGTSQSKNTRSAICRVKYNETTGETSGDVEIVVDELVGFKYGSLHFFGDYMYYATPCASKNKKAEILYNKTCFKRYDLVNKKSYTIYTTQLNDDSESVEYAYYVVDNTLNLLVYESSMYTLKSFKIDKKVTENYTISDVVDCYFSETYGKPTTSENFDANSFVYYALEHGKYEGEQDGVKVYKTSPIKNNSVLLSNDQEVEFISIRAGKLIYSNGTNVYASTITSKTTDKLHFDDEHCIYHGIPENAIYIENYKLEETTGNDAKLVSADGEIVVLTLKATNKIGVISLSQWSTEGSVHDNILISLNILSEEISDFGFVGTAILEEIEEVEASDGDDEQQEGNPSDPTPATTEGNESSNANDEENSESDDENVTEVKVSYLYVVYQNANTVYKLKIAKINDDGTMDIVINSSESVKLSGSEISETTGLLAPEIIGNYLFIFAENDDELEYLIKVDLTPIENVSKESPYIAIEEDAESDD